MNSEAPSSARGATTIEATIVVSLVLLFSCVCIDLGRIFLIQNAANRAALVIVETAKVDPRLGSEMRSQWATATSKANFAAGRRDAIAQGLQIMRTVAFSTTDDVQPRLLHYQLPDFSGGTVEAEAALNVPGQAVRLVRPSGGQDEYRYVPMSRRGDSHCNQPNNGDENCACTSTTCPDLYLPGTTSMMREFRRNPFEARVSVYVKPILLLRFFVPQLVITGTALSSPERAPNAKNAIIPTRTCGALYPWYINPCNGVTCGNSTSGDMILCARAPDATVTINGEGCSECRRATCQEALEHAGLFGMHWTSTFSGISNYCRSQPGISSNANDWADQPTFGDLTQDIIQNTGGDAFAQCVTCRKPTNCLEAFWNIDDQEATSRGAACPAGQSRRGADTDYYWTARPADEITIENCYPCNGDSRCGDVHPNPDPSCTRPVFQEYNIYDPSQPGGGCYLCEGLCKDRTTKAETCGTSCPEHHYCDFWEDSPYNPSDPHGSCCGEGVVACSEWHGAGTCDTFHVSEGHTCMMTGDPGAGTCHPIEVCTESAACPQYQIRNQTTCLCECNAASCPSGQVMLPGTCSCTSASCNPPQTSCPNGQQLIAGCCVEPF